MRVQYISSKYQIADIFFKPLASAPFSLLRNKLRILSSNGEWVITYLLLRVFWLLFLSVRVQPTYLSAHCPFSEWLQRSSTLDTSWHMAITKTTWHTATIQEVNRVMGGHGGSAASYILDTPQLKVIKLPPLTRISFFYH